MDVLKKCADYTLHHEMRDRALYPYYREISSAQDPIVTISGQKVVMLGSNNYLGLSNNSRVVAAATPPPARDPGF